MSVVPQLSNPSGPRPEDFADFTAVLREYEAFGQSHTMLRWRAWLDAQARDARDNALPALERQCEVVRRGLDTAERMISMLRAAPKQIPIN